MTRSLVVRYLKVDKNGTYKYRRRVPEKLQRIVGKKEFVKVLGKSESEALENYGACHAEFEKLGKLAVHPGLDGDRITAKQEATELLQSLGVDPHSAPKDDMDETARDAFVDEIFRKYPINPSTGHPEGLTPLDEALATALAAGIDRFEAEPTIVYAFDFYLREKEITDPHKRKKQIQRYERVRDALLTVTGQDLPLSKLKRHHARTLKDRWLTRMKPESARRYNNDLKAVLNFAIREFDLECKNPFEKLDFGKSTETAEEKRLPLPRSVILGMYNDLTDNPTLLAAWTLLHHTGAQTAEILGLLHDDLHLDEPTPHLTIAPNDLRSVKTTARQRQVPLVGLALTTARRLHEETGPGEPLFRDYAPSAKHENFSNTMNKRLRKHTQNDKHVVYSLRHRMKDELRDVDAGRRVELAILGHSRDRSAEAQYGSPIGLEQMRDALLKVEFPIPSSLLSQSE